MPRRRSPSSRRCLPAAGSPSPSRSSSGGITTATSPINSACSGPSIVLRRRDGRAPALRDAGAQHPAPRDDGGHPMEHRRFLPHREAHRPFVGGDLFARVGGRAAIDALIDGLYERIEADTALRPLFGRDLSGEREGQKRFFIEWLGGESVYSDQAYLPLKHRHDLLPITRRLAERWLAHFAAS